MSDPMQEQWQMVSQKLTQRLFKLRFWVVLGPLLFGLAFLFWDPVAWKIAWIGVVTVVLLGLFFIEYLRVQRAKVGQGTMQLNLMGMLLMQTALIYLTGGIESPLMPIFIPMALGAGILLREYWRVLSVVALPLVLTLFFAGSRLYGWVPLSTPAFFELGREAVADKPVYIWTQAGIFCGLYIVTSALAHFIRRIVDQQVRENIRGKQRNLTSLASRNKELLSVSRTIAHELKTPLDSIQGQAQVLARGAQAGDKQAEGLEAMQKELARMGEVLDGFRNFTRPLSELSLEPCEMAGLVAEVGALHEGLAVVRSVILELGLSPVQVTCDPQKVKQALLNLVQNALEESQPGTKIFLRCGPWHKGARIEIQDEGAGLSSEAKEHLFEPGFTCKEGGSGVGLVMARSIVEQHGGRLALEANESGNGCLASVFLPDDAKGLPEAGTDPSSLRGS